MGQDRLQKILSRAGIASRRKSEELIRQGRVTVNGEVASIGDKADAEADAIKVDGKIVPPPVPSRYLVLNKPDGYVSTRSDPKGRPTVMDLVPPQFRKALVPVGRLDYHTEGLLLLTTDGEWAQKVAHPRYGCAKTYEVKVKGVPDDDTIDKLRRGGMWIDGRRTRPAKIHFMRTTGRTRTEGNSWWKVTLFQGITRQIREMFFRVGHPVQKLRRVSIGPLTDASLPVGACRELTSAEVRSLERAGERRSKRRSGSERSR